jgi:glyceraldehyde-3-phosphate dehydrogenase (NAD(P))
MDAIRASMKMQGDSASGTAETNKYLDLGRWK